MAAPKPALRRIEAFHLNVHMANEPLQDYELLRPVLVGMSPHNLKSQTRHFAFHISDEHGLLFGLSYEGDPDAEALLYDTSAGTERVTPRRAGEIVATRTHFALDLATRVVAFEYNHRGTKKDDFEELLQQLITELSAKSHFESDASLVPIPERTFLEELAEYERIQSAKVVLVRPNVSWLDGDSRLFKYADQSDAQAMSLEARAKRNSSLSKRHGLISDLRGVVTQGITTVREAIIVGTKFGSKLRRQMKLSRHTLNTVVPLARMPDGQPNRDEMKRHVLEFCGSLAKSHPAGGVDR